MSADNYLMVEERKNGWCVTERHVSDDEESPGRRLSGPFPTFMRAMIELPGLTQELNPEHGIGLKGTPRVKINVETSGKEFFAYIEGHRDVSGRGRTAREAVGNLVVTHSIQFAIRINTQ